MKKSEIEVYMDAFMEGFWQCYDMMMDMMDDDLSQDSAEPSQGIVKDSRKTTQELSEIKPDSSEKSKPEATKPSKIQKIDRGKVCALLDAGWKVPKIAGEMHASEATIYNIQKEYREQKAKQETQA